jgi:hypothetical protein
MDFLAYRTEYEEDSNSFTRHNRAISAEDLILDPYSEDPDLKNDHYFCNQDCCYFTFDIQNFWGVSFEIFWDIYDGMFFH